MDAQNAQGCHRVIYRTSHPGMGEWGRQATAKMTGIPTSIGAQLLAHGEGYGTGVLAPEAAFDPTRFIAELARRGIRVEERIEEHGIIDVRFADALSRGYVATPVRVANDGKSSQL